MTTSSEIRSSPSGPLFDVAGAQGAFGGAFTFPYAFSLGTPPPDPGLGQQMTWTQGITFELATQMSDDDADVVMLFECVRAPNIAKQLTVGDHLSGTGRQQA